MPSIRIFSEIRSSLNLKSAAFKDRPDYYTEGQIQDLEPENDVHRINQGDTNVEVFIETGLDLNGFIGMAKAFIRKPSGLTSEVMCTVSDPDPGIITFNSGMLFEEEGEYLINSFIDYGDGRKLTGDPAIIQVHNPKRLQFP